MRLKSFYANTMTEAMQMVRDTLGDDAVIVATREERGGNIHVTAAIEPHFEIKKGGAAAGDDWLQYDEEEEESAVAEEITESMLRHNVPEDVMDNIISCATVVGLDEPGEALTAAIEHLFSFRPLPKRRTNTAQMFVGTPGSGKTLAVAKLAARSTVEGLKVGVISCDTMRAGGVEQLAAFTNLLKIDLKRANDAKHLKSLLTDMAHYDQILIDTHGINPFDKEDVRTIARLMNAGPITSHLTLQAGTDTEESSEIGRIFSTLGVETMIATRLDIARRLGGLLAAAHNGKLGFLDASNTPKVADGLLGMNAYELSRLLMPRAFRRQTTPSSHNIGAAGTGRH